MTFKYPYDALFLLGFRFYWDTLYFCIKLWSMICGSDVLLPITNPSCPGESRPFSKLYLTNLLLMMVRNNLPRHDINEMPR